MLTSAQQQFESKMQERLDSLAGALQQRPDSPRAFGQSPRYRAPQSTTTQASQFSPRTSAVKTNPGFLTAHERSTHTPRQSYMSAAERIQTGSTDEARPSLIPPDARIPRAQGSSGATATVPFVWRGHTKSRTTRAGRALDLALRLG